MQGAMLCMSNACVPQAWLNHCTPFQSFASHMRPDSLGLTYLTSPLVAGCPFSPTRS